MANPKKIDAPSEAESLRQTMHLCSLELENAIDLKAGVMDSESEVQAINAQRIEIMQSVATRLREA